MTARTGRTCDACGGVWREATWQAGVWQGGEGAGCSGVKNPCFPEASAVGGRMWGSVTFHLALRGPPNTEVIHGSSSGWQVDFSGEIPSSWCSLATCRAVGGRPLRRCVRAQLPTAHSHPSPPASRSQSWSRKGNRQEGVVGVTALGGSGAAGETRERGGRSLHGPVCSCGRVWPPPTPSRVPLLPSEPEPWRFRRPAD